MELLESPVPHRVAHDLESLFYVLIFICTHLKGPGNDVGDPPIYGGKMGSNSKHKSALREWMELKDVKSLRYAKMTHMFYGFQKEIMEHISPYFKPLSHHISSLRTVLFPTGLGGESLKSTATGVDFIKVFKSVFEDEILIKAAQEPHSNPGKRSHPGDLYSEGWNAAKIPKKLSSAEPKKNPSVPRAAKLMKKSRRLV